MSILAELGSPVDGSDIRLPARRVVDQASVNACFSCALATCLEAQDTGVPPLASLFHFYYAAKLWPGASDNGIANETIAYGAFRDHGICAGDLYSFPFAKETLDRQPSESAIADARGRIPPFDEQGASPWRPLYSGQLSSVRWRKALQRGQPVLLILYTNESYWNMKNGQTDAWAATDKDFSSRLHAAAILGTNEKRKAFIVQDSRGPSFGAGGQWFLRFDLAGGSAIDASFTLEYPE